MPFINGNDVAFVGLLVSLGEGMFRQTEAFWQALVWGESCTDSRLVNK
jgi:hypothetical protein